MNANFVLKFEQQYDYDIVLQVNGIYSVRVIRAQINDVNNQIDNLYALNMFSQYHVLSNYSRISNFPQPYFFFLTSLGLSMCSL